MNSFEEEIKAMIKEGYLSEKDLSPLKCAKCDSTNLKDENYSFEGFSVLCSYERHCKDCGSIVGYWSYGSWEI